MLQTVLGFRCRETRILKLIHGPKNFRFRELNRFLFFSLTIESQLAPLSSFRNLMLCSWLWSRAIIKNFLSRHHDERRISPAWTPGGLKDGFPRVAQCLTLTRILAATWHIWCAQRQRTMGTVHCTCWQLVANHQPADQKRNDSIGAYSLLL